MQEKISWINALKTIGILAVILGHINSPFTNFIFSWHMPLFFITGGFFLKLNISFAEFVKKDFKRLMLPYFIFSFLGLFVEILKRSALNRDSLNVLNEIRGILFNMDMSALLNHYGFVLWFLPALFFARVLVFTISKISKNLFINLLMILIFFYFSFIYRIPFALDKAANASLWVFIGYAFYQFFLQSKILYILPLTAIFIAISTGIPSLNMSMTEYSFPALNIFWATGFIYLLIFALQRIHYNEAFNYFFQIVGEATMLLFVFHPYTNNVSHLIVEKIQFGGWILKFLLSILLLSLLIILKRKYNQRGIFKYV